MSVISFGASCCNARQADDTELAQYPKPRLLFTPSQGKYGSAHYGLDALHIATAVKLSRALWIIPLALAAAAAFRTRKTDGQIATQQKPKVRAPWFIGFFILASVARSFVPGLAAIAPALGHLATTGLTLTLFLIGAGLSAKTLRTVGWRPFCSGSSSASPPSRSLSDLSEQHT